MNGVEDGSSVVTVTLPSGAPIKVAIVGASSDDGVESVGLRELNFGGALDTVRELGSLIVEKLEAAKPTRTMVELRIGFAVEAGKLTSLIVNGRGDASLTVTLEWSNPSRAGGQDG
jgi:hypothetical protein